MKETFILPAHLTISFRNLAVFERRMKAKNLIVHMPSAGHTLSIDWLPLAKLVPPIALMAGDEPLRAITVLEPAGRLTDLGHLSDGDAAENKNEKAWSLSLAGGFLQGLRPELLAAFKRLEDYRWIFDNFGIYQLTNRAIFQLRLAEDVNYSFQDSKGDRADIPKDGLNISIINNEIDGGRESLEHFLSTGELNEFDHLANRVGLKVPRPTCDEDTLSTIGRPFRDSTLLSKNSILCEVPFCPIAIVHT